MNRDTVVYEDELEALRDSRKRDMPVFAMRGDYGNVGKLWVVAVSELQALTALTYRIFPVVKLSKRERDLRYTELLELAAEKFGKPGVAANGVATKDTADEEGEA